MEELRNRYDKELRLRTLKEAKLYCCPDDDVPCEPEEFLGDDYEKFVSDYKEYKESLQECNSLEDLAKVLNLYTDQFGDGSEYYVVKF